MGTINVLDATGASQTVAKIDATGQTTMTNSLPIAVASDQSPIPTTTPTPSAPVCGQYKLTATATVIGSSALVNGLVIKAKSTNIGNVYVGGSSVSVVADGTGNGYELSPGEAISFAVSNISSIYAIGTANDVIFFAGN